MRTVPKISLNVFCSVVAALGLFGGAAFMIVADPANSSARAAALSAAAYANDDFEGAAGAALVAVKSDPSNVTGWRMLALAAERTGQPDESRKAGKIADMLQQKNTDVSPFYAAPARLRLSALAPEDLQRR